MLYGLLYSGGVDSIVCLKMLHDQGITPVLFHFHDSLKTHLKDVKKTAKLISPQSQLYIWTVDDYQAYLRGFNGNYYIQLNRKPDFDPCSLVDKLVVGYYEKDVDKTHPVSKGAVRMRKGIKYLSKNPKIVLPLRKLNQKQIEKIWKTLPKKARIRTLTTTRKPNGEWKCI